MSYKFFQNKSILLIAPKFFGYDRAVADKLREMGAEVTGIDDRPSNSLLTKASIRVNKNLLAKKTSRYYENICKTIVNKSFDIIFLLNPEALPISFLEFCKQRWKKAQYIMYMWDSVNNRKHTLEFVPFCDRVFTFDKDDACEYGFSFKPLFYLDKYTEVLKSDNEIIYDICFMGTLRADRYYIAKSIKNWSDESSFKSFFYFFSPGKLLYYYNRLIEKNVTAPPNEVSFEKMTTEQIIEILAASRIVLDIQHPKQTGLTIRTLEAVGSGKKLITTNTSIKDYDFYYPENILVIDRQNPMQAMNPEFFEENYKPIPESVRMSYSIGSWLTSILSLESNLVRAD